MDHREQFETVFRETQSRVRSYIAGMGVPLDDVDDVAQDVFLAYFRQGDQAPAGVEPIRWLKGIARNLCLEYFRRRRVPGGEYRLALAELLEAADSAFLARLTDPDPTDTQQALGHCLDRLSAKNRQLLDLRYQQNLPSHRIAAQVGATAEAVRIALMRTRSALRECVTKTLAEVRA
jgi:RNA polymerase sigma-70 factor (ECF subfamily)